MDPQLSLSNINGQYIKFYFTTNKNLPALLKDTGALIILQEKVQTYINENNINSISTEDLDSLLIDQSYIDECTKNNQQPYVYSVWLCNTKILSGYGLYNNSNEFLSKNLSRLLREIDQKVNLNSNYILRYPNTGSEEESKDNNLKELDIKKTYNDNIINIDPDDYGLNISETYFTYIDELTGERKYILVNQLPDFVDYKINDYHKLRNIQLYNVVYTLEYYENEYSTNLKYKTIICDDVYYSADQKHNLTSSSSDELSNLVPEIKVFEIKENSIIKKINVQFNLKFPDEVKNKQYTLSGKVLDLSSPTDNSQFISQTFVSEGITNIISSNIINKTPRAISNHKCNCYLYFDFESGYTQYNEYIYLPTLSFNMDFVPNINIFYSMTNGQKSTTQPAYIYNDSNVYLLNYKLQGANVKFNDNGEIYNLENEKFYFLVKDGIEITELYMKCYSNSNYILPHYTNITNLTYRYTNTYYKNSDGEKFIIYACDFIDLFKSFTRGNRNDVELSINRIMIRIVTDYQELLFDREVSTDISTTDDTLSYLIQNHDNYNVVYLKSTQFDTTNWTDTLQGDNINNNYFNFIS